MNYTGNTAYREGREDYLYPSEARSLRNCPYAEGTFERRCYMAGRSDAADALRSGSFKYAPGEI